MQSAQLPGDALDADPESPVNLLKVAPGAAAPSPFFSNPF
jgi:hypothetical protein